MILFCRLPVLIIAGMLIILFGCSQGGNPVLTSDSHDSSETMPLILTSQTGVNNSLGIMGAFNLDVNLSNQTAELTPMRVSTIGESYLVSGIGFFTVAPCTDCLKIAGFEFTGGYLVLKFKIRHPFNPGDPTAPPTAINRLDLDVFDLALVVVPSLALPVNFPEIGVDVLADVIENADGYTRELANLINDDTALPFVLVVDNTLSLPPHNWNEFGMGAESFFDVFFELTVGLPLRFEMYLTMGYGFSAKKPQRLTPKYYNPEFNRKAAWKVEVKTYDPWLDSPLTSNTVFVDVYDWQIGAIVYGGDDFENAPSDNIFAPSEVEYVKVEIPGMAPAVTVNTPTGGTGLPDDPLTYEVPIANTNMLPPGLYLGVVQVMDERRPLTPADGRDFLIDSPNGVDLNHYVIPEYATYQLFPAEVVHEGITLYQNDYNLDGAIINDSENGSVVLAYASPPIPHYFNLNVNGMWIIQNLPVLPHPEQGAPQAFSVDFPLRVPNGTDVQMADAGWALTDMPLTTPPPLGPQVPVHSRSVTIHTGEINERLDHAAAAEIVCVTMTDFAFKPKLPNQECGTNECVPAAISNSLKMLRGEHGKPPAGKDVSIGGMKGPTGWTPAGCPWPGWANGKKDYMNNNGYQIDTTVIQNPTAADLATALAELKRCQDVEIRAPGHVAAVRTIARFSDGSYVIGINHDTKQGQAGGTIWDYTYYNPTTGKFSGGAGFNGKSLGGIVIECPKP